jgi:hypothetical protein
MTTLERRQVNSVAVNSVAVNSAVGAGAAGAAYEYQNKMVLESLEDDWKAGRISQDEYLRRKKEIEIRSLVYSL